jgi:uncharacterized GH25 family protein
MRTLRAHLATVVLLTGAATLAHAHDFWLVPDAFRLAPGGELIVRGQTSSAFPTSESAVTVDRITAARILGASDEEQIKALSTTDKSLLLRHRPSTSGQKVVAVAVGWRHMKETADSFRKYLIAEGAEDALRHYEKTGALPTAPIVRRYAKYAKTVVEVGQGPRTFERVVNHPLEFVPLADPSATRPGSEFRVRLLFQGAPLPNARLHAGVAQKDHAGGHKDVDLRTATDGSVALPLTTSGLWNVRTIHVVPSPAGADANWDVHWATLVFEVK